MPCVIIAIGPGENGNICQEKDKNWALQLQSFVSNNDETVNCRNKVMSFAGHFTHHSTCCNDQAGLLLLGPICEGFVSHVAGLTNVFPDKVTQVHRHGTSSCILSNLVLVLYLLSCPQTLGLLNSVKDKQVIKRISGSFEGSSENGTDLPQMAL